ncbi:MAG TPA: amino acid adenylation domain-containing protein, partial [Longimicrobiaceae bacterium]|nr:amino acid adenylation domain-containing protein [Longimicrobiaceae bacterium]
AYQHQEIPFERVVEELAPERSLAHTPLFPVMFVLQNNERGGLRMGTLEMEPLAARSGGEIAKFDLTLALVEDEQGFAGSLSYRTELWERAVVERMAGHLARLGGAVATDASLPVAGVAFIPDEERVQVLAEWGATGHDYPAGACIHDLFAAQARRTPDAVAVVHLGQTLTYAELERASSRLAHALRRRGVGPETRVGVCMRRTPSALVALLGVLRAGGAYVPLDPEIPTARAAFMLEDAGVHIVLTESTLTDRLPEGLDLLSLDGEVASVATAEPEEAPATGVTPENLAYLIFTSGSTGSPKGVAIQHRGAVVLLRFMREVVPAQEWASVLGATSFSFDVSIAEVFGTLCWGGKLVLVDSALDLPSVAEQEVRLVVTVPTAAAELLRRRDIPRSVRAFNLAGEALTAELAQGLYGLGHVDAVRNLYGPTEDTTYSTWTRVPSGSDSVRIGRSVAGSQAYVLDGQMQPQAVGVPGELYLAGEGLARGYSGRPELTAERFVPNPFGEPGSRMYRVMDRARWRLDGELEYLGRTDQQVKVRGFRIELGEVEGVLERHAVVYEAVVVALDDASGGLRLVAYVVPAEGAGGEVPAAELRSHLKAHLPEYMVPSVFVRLSTLPLTASGKVDRRALPAPESAGGAREYMVPSTPTEELLAGIWGDVLGVERVGAEDDFFGLGGHSLLATRVVSRVRQAFGVELPLRALFEAPTVAGLAGRIGLLRAGGEGTQAPPLVALPRDGSALPLSFAQRRLWFIDQLEPGSAAYNMPFPLRMCGAFSLHALERAVTRIVRRHESLRTTFPLLDGEPVQHVAPPAPVWLPVVDLGGVESAAREAELERLASAEARRPFDLAAGPLLRTTVVRLAEEENGVLFTMHHVVSDGWSIGILEREVSTLYRAYSRGEEVNLPELAVQYADYALWQRSWLSGERLDREIGYWKERLDGAPTLLNLPTDRPRPAVPDDAAAREWFSAGSESTAALRALSLREGATLFMTLLSAWQLLLGRYAGQEDVMVGTPIAGRNRLETEGLIGLFINTLVLRADLSRDPSFGDLLHQAREATLGAYQHQEVPFEKLVEELGVERSLTHTPLFQVLFVFQNNERGGLVLDESRLERIAIGPSTVKFDLSLNVTETERGIEGSLSYRRELWDPATITRLVGHFGYLLEQVAADPSRRVSRVSLLRGPERTQVLEARNETAADYPCGLRIHESFAAQAARTPDAVAVVSGDESLTYAELDRAANQVAHVLAARGVGPDALVGICLERGVPVLVAILGVLKAGGAYVPLDPAHPEERLRGLLRDAGAPVLLTQQSLAGRAQGYGGAVLRLDADREEIEAAPAGAPRSGVEAGNLAYVIYTSGSTGMPKGVLVEHRQLANYVQAVTDRIGLEVPLRYALVSTLAADLGNTVLYPTLCTGGTLHVLSREETTESERFAAYLERHEIDVVKIVPSHLAALVAGTEGARGLPRRVLVLGGEAPRGEWVEGLKGRAPGLEVVNHYGPTETTVGVLTHRVDGGASGGRVAETVPLGRPLGNARVYVLDGAGEPVPVGVYGELYVGGAQVGRGYLGRVDLSAERFLPDPFSPEAGARLYRTGDRVRWLAGGEVEFLGRMDHQVKVRGFRVELGEIEAALRGHASVQDAVVLAREDAPGERRLVAYVVAAEGEEVSGADLRAHLTNRLPEYMVPGPVVVLEMLPLTPNGKVDRRALPAPEWSGEAVYVAPRTPAEEMLAGILGEVLRLERVGIDENFFELGGHSLLATRVVSRVRQAFGVELPLRALFEAPTVAGLAGRIGLLRA